MVLLEVIICVSEGKSVMLREALMTETGSWMTRSAYAKYDAPPIPSKETKIVSTIMLICRLAIPMMPGRKLRKNLRKSGEEKWAFAEKNVLGISFTAGHKTHKNCAAPLAKTIHAKYVAMI